MKSDGKVVHDGQGGNRKGATARSGAQERDVQVYANVK